MNCYNGSVCLVDNSIVLDKVLVLGTGVVELALIRELRERGFYVCAVSNTVDDRVKNETDEYYKINTTNFPKIKELIEREGILNAFSIGSDMALRTLAKLASRFGWENHPSEEKFEFLHNKGKVREALKAQGLSDIPCRSATEFSEDIFDFNEYEKLVIKPADGYGGKGIYAVEEYNDKERLFKLAKASSVVGEIIVEPYISGRQFIVEFFVTREDEVILVSAAEKQVNDHFTPYLFIERSTLEFKKKVTGFVEALSLENGFYSVDLIESERGVELMDIAPRLGGSHLVMLYKQTYDTDLMKDYVDFVLEGKEIEKRKIVNDVAMYILHHKDGGTVTYLDREMEFIKSLQKEIWVDVDDKIASYKHSNHQQGFVIFEVNKKETLSEIDELFEENQIIHVK